MIDNFFRNSGMCAEDPFENGRYLILWSSNSNTYFVRPSSRLKAEETPAFFWIETRPSHYHSKTHSTKSSPCTTWTSSQGGEGGMRQTDAEAVPWRCHRSLIADALIVRGTAALDRHRTSGSREEVPTHQRLSRNLVAEGTLESVAHSAEGGPDSRSCLNLVVRKAYSAKHRESLQSTKTRTSSIFWSNRVTPG